MTFSRNNSFMILLNQAFYHIYIPLVITYSQYALKEVLWVTLWNLFPFYKLNNNHAGLKFLHVSVSGLEIHVLVVQYKSIPRFIYLKVRILIYLNTQNYHLNIIIWNFPNCYINFALIFGFQCNFFILLFSSI